MNFGHLKKRILIIWPRLVFLFRWSVLTICYEELHPPFSIRIVLIENSIILNFNQLRECSRDVVVAWSRLQNFWVLFRKNFSISVAQKVFQAWLKSQQLSVERFFSIFWSTHGIKFAKDKSERKFKGYSGILRREVSIEISSNSIKLLYTHRWRSKVLFNCNFKYFQLKW
jgi:hypothetical protein